MTEKGPCLSHSRKSTESYMQQLSHLASVAEPADHWHPHLLLPGLAACGSFAPGLVVSSFACAQRRSKAAHESGVCSRKQAQHSDERIRHMAAKSTEVEILLQGFFTYPGKKHFRASHYFLIFCIRAQQTGTLFAGRVHDSPTPKPHPHKSHS